MKLIALLFTLISTTAFAQGHYDEVFENGQVKPQYQLFWKIFKNLSAEDLKKFTDNSVKDFDGDNALLALPRVLTAEESATLKAGAEQRARAIQLFLKDHYSGKKLYIKSGMIPKELIQDAIVRNKEDAYQGGMLKNADFSFWYGPDIIRDQDGNFRVIEDNLGYIGGMGDLRIARESLARNIPEYKKLLEQSYNPMKFYTEIAKRYKESAKELGGSALLVTYPDSISADNEDSRIRELFDREGIPSYIYRSANGKARQSLLVQDGDLYLSRFKDGKKTMTKITHVVLDTETQDFAKWGSKNRLSGFWDLVNQGKVRVTNTLGTEFVNDKGVYPYVEEMIRLYLNEEPILKNIETYTASAAMLDVARKDRASWVAKGVTGRGGDSVYIGSKMNEAEWEEVLQSITKDYNGYIFQKYTALSVMADHIVDLRVLTDVLGASAYASRTPWGRALPTNGNGKVNISDQGRETTVISLRPEFCSALLKGEATVQ